MKGAFIPLILSFLLCTALNGQQKETTRAADKSQPFATICSINSGTIEKDSLMKAESLVCSEKSYSIISFKMFRVAEELKSNSNLLTEEMKKYLGEMRSGSKLCFLDIFARTPEGKTISLNPIIVKIK